VAGGGDRPRHGGWRGPSAARRGTVRRLILEAALATGQPISEVERLSWDDLDAVRDILKQMNRRR
jgi:integrase